MSSRNLCLKGARRARLALLGALALAACAAALGPPAADGGPPDHECHIFGYLFGDGAGTEELLGDLCQDLYEQTLPARRDSPSRDGWGFGYYLAPPHAGITRPMLIKGGQAASDDPLRWEAARQEAATYGMGGAGCILGHVRKSSYGPDYGALPNPHPFADSLMGRWWLFSHNGHMVPDTLLAWIPADFLAAHPLDYAPIYVDSEVLFRYCLYEVDRLGSVIEGLRYALHRVKGYNDFVFNICLTDGDTLWTAHTLSYTPFYYDAAADSAAWWASTVQGDGEPHTMSMNRIYWFTASAMGVASYE